MRFLCLSDIHGHADALHAVLATADRRGYTRILVAGDHCFPGPQPLETWRLLTATNATCAQGLGDRALATLDVSKVAAATAHEEARLAMLRGTRDALGELILARLAKLPPQVRIPLPNGDELLLVHGSPHDPTEGMGQEMTDEELLALIGDDPADVVVCGSTHVPFDRSVGGVRIVNVGSVGEAPGGAFAHATLIEVTADGVEVEQFVVPLEKAA
jgi:predicted phosphodiesterase